MNHHLRISAEVTVGGQPTVEEIDILKQRGFRTIINFRNPGEEEQPLSPEDEGKHVRAAGLQYLHIPVSMKTMGPETVDRFREQFPKLPKPIYAHCKSGKRAGGMVLMHYCAEQGLNGEQLLEEARKVGFECDQPALRQFVTKYADEHARK